MTRPLAQRKGRAAEFAALEWVVGSNISAFELVGNTPTAEIGAQYHAKVGEHALDA